MSEVVEELREVTVAPEDIERLLKKMRSELDPTGPTQPEFKPNVILSNFIITLCSPLAAVRDRLEKLSQELALLVPSRFFIVSLAENDIQKLDTSVRVKEIKSSSGHEFYSEEIFISASKSTLPLVSSLLRGLCISDVSIISYVMGEPSGEGDSAIDDLLQQLRNICDLFLYDSLDFQDYHKSVNSLFSLRRIVRPHNEIESRKLAPTSVRLRDLNWYRHERLRSLLAGLYDASDVTTKSIREVEVLLNQSKPNPTALILAGWLEEILGKKDLVKIVTGSTSSDKMDTFIKVVVKGKGFELSVSQDGDQFEVSSGDSIRKLSSKPLSSAQLISLPVQSSGLDDFFTKSLERSLSNSPTWA